MLKNIPNIITCINLLAGCSAIVASFSGNLVLAACLVVIAGFADFFDGVAARLLKAKSEFGKQLDSLADIVSFGAAPGMIAFVLVKNTGTPNADWLAYVTLVIPLCSAIRLAKFNTDNRQTDHFLGLPTPANGIFFASFPLVITHGNSRIGELLTSAYAIPALSIVMSLLMLAEIPMFSLKMKDMSWDGNKIRYSYLFSVILFLIIFKATALPAIIVLYLLFSLINNFIEQK